MPEIPAASFRAGVGLPTGTGGASISSTLAAAAPGIIGWAVFLACLALVVRRRWPVAVFSVGIAAQLTFLLAPLPTGALVLLVASYTVPVYRSSRTGWIAFGTGSAAVVIPALVLSATGAVAFSTASNTVLGGIVLMLIGTLVGINVGNRRRYLEAIIARSRQLLVERDQQARLAAAAERTRIAREMHDIVSHSLTVIVALADGAAATPDAARARVATEHVAVTARTALAEMRAMLGVLHDPDAPADAPLAPADDVSITAAVGAAQRAGFPVTMTVSGESAQTPSTVGFAVARIVREALTNAMRHAPRATRIDVTVRYAPDGVDVEVENDAVPATAARQDAGYGLRGLRERVTHVGGTLAAGPAGDGLWRVSAHIPLQVPSADRIVPARKPAGASVLAEVTDARAESRA